MGKSRKKLEGISAGKYKHYLRKEKRISIKHIAKELGKGNYDAEIDYRGTLYNVQTNDDLHTKHLTPYARRKYGVKIMIFSDILNYCEEKFDENTNKTIYFRGLFYSVLSME